MSKHLTVFAFSTLLAPLSLAGFTSGRLAVSLVGDGAGALTSASTVAALYEFDKLTLGQTGSKIVDMLTVAGSATSEGVLTRSTDGAFLSFAGYDAPAGVAAIGGTAPTLYNRVVQRVAPDGSMILLKFDDAYGSGNIRGAVSNGIREWMSGTSSASGGVRVDDTVNPNKSIQVAVSPTNVRVVNIFGGDLYFSSASGTFVGINRFTGLPTNTGNSSTLLFGLTSGTGTPSPYDFWFADASTAYVADDRTIANGGGLQKWVYSDSTWSLATTFTTGLTAGLRGLAGEVVGGQNVLYAVTGDAISTTAGNKLVRIVDTGAGAAFDTLATAPGNRAFRGVDLTPEAVPEPATLAALGIGALGLLARRKRK